MKQVLFISLLLALVAFAACDRKPVAQAHNSSGEKQVAVEPQKPAPSSINNELNIQIEPAHPKVAVGEQLTLTGTLHNKPSKISRWLLSTAWHFGDDKKDVGHPDYKAKDIHVTTAHAWDKPGTYKVVLKYYANNKVLGESAVDVVVE
jgi:hypothetical protein